MASNNNDTNTRGLVSVIASSSVGTLIEWYDFYIFGSLALIISTKFFPAGNQTAALLSTLATFAAGFIVRPFGALFFGRLGDLIGRKYTFLVTLTIMGGATFCIGLIPSFETIGWLAPILVLVLRLLQGLALGGEYGGAATYVAEHAPKGQRGFWTSWIQTTATLGLFVSLFVILITKSSLGDAAWNDWGWRLPFLLSILLVAVSIVIRLRMAESPMFAKIKSEGTVSVNPLKESFGHRDNLKMVLLALFGATMGQGVVWYTGQFYAQLFLLNTCSIEANQVNTWLGLAFLIGTPGFVLFAWLSDKIGRKGIMMLGMALAVVFIKPIFQQMYSTASVTNKSEDVSKKEIKDVMTLAANKVDSLSSSTVIRYYTDGTKFTQKTETTMFADSTKKAKDYKPKVTKTVVLPDSAKWPLMLNILTLMIFITMVYGPMAAFLVELFPTRIRYTSMSLPYHIGNGVFGGLVPFIGTLIFEYSKTKELPTGDPFAGLVYPITVALVCLILGTFLIPNKGAQDMND